MWIGGVVTRHRAAVARELPKVADLMTLGTESGLELLSATDMAARLSPGPVGLVLRGALDETNAGRELLAALRAVPSRVGGHTISAFIGSVVQGLELGTPVARVLRVQADGLRVKRRQALEAKIAGLSMKLTLITVLLFVPALLVITVLPNLLAFLRGSW
jgi:tight adherence protein C